MNRALIATGGSLLLLLGACSKDVSTGDFKSQTEKFLNSNKDVKEKLGVSFTDASCQEPASKDVDTSYTCTATAEDGSTWAFKVQITSKNGFTVETAQPSDSSSTPATGETTPGAAETTVASPDTAAVTTTG